MTEISGPLTIPDLKEVVAGSVRPVRRRREGGSGPLTVWSTLEPWRAVLPAAFLALWVGFSLLPNAHLALRVPTTISLAFLIGVGAELCARAPERGAIGRLAARTLWIIPTGATVVILVLLASTGPQLSSATPLLAAGVVATMGLQVLEVSGSRALGSWSRPVNTGVAFALALAVFVLTPSLHTVVGAAVNALVGALVALVVLRGCRATAWELTGFVGLAACLTGELGLMLDDVRPPFLTSLVLLLGLYAVSTTAQAVLDRAPRRAYAEVVLVTVTALALAALAVSRR
jgi:hypothetical protein